MQKMFIDTQSNAFTGVNKLYKHYNVTMRDVEEIFLLVPPRM